MTWVAVIGAAIAVDYGVRGLQLQQKFPDYRRSCWGMGCPRIAGLLRRYMVGILVSYIRYFRGPLFLQTPMWLVGTHRLGTAPTH